MNWDFYGVYQRTDSDCGIAAIATLVGLPYDHVATAFGVTTNRKPGASSYKDLIATMGHLGIKSKKVTKAKWCIRRARHKQGDRHSHWVVTYSDGAIWCPTLGFFKGIELYGMPHLGHGIVLV